MSVSVPMLHRDDRVEITTDFRALSAEWHAIVGKRGVVKRIKAPSAVTLIHVELDDAVGTYWFRPRELRKLSILELIAEAAQ